VEQRDLAARRPPRRRDARRRELRGGAAQPGLDQDPRVADQHAEAGEDEELAELAAADVALLGGADADLLAPQRAGTKRLLHDGSFTTAPPRRDRRRRPRRARRRRPPSGTPWSSPPGCRTRTR